jgi:hypothetical protein
MTKGYEKKIRVLALIVGGVAGGAISECRPVYVRDAYRTLLKVISEKKTGPSLGSKIESISSARR